MLYQSISDFLASKPEKRYDGADAVIPNGAIISLTEAEPQLLVFKNTTTGESSQYIGYYGRLADGTPVSISYGTLFRKSYALKNDASFDDCIRVCPKGAVRVDKLTADGVAVVSGKLIVDTIKDVFVVEGAIDRKPKFGQQTNVRIYKSAE